jgi:hypothetical protein
MLIITVEAHPVPEGEGGRPQIQTVAGSEMRWYSYIEIPPIF